MERTPRTTLGARIREHASTTFVAGLFTCVPLLLTYFAVMQLDKMLYEPTQPLVEKTTGSSHHFVGIALVLVGIYGVGLLVRSMAGRRVMERLDGLLRRLPVVDAAYESWLDFRRAAGSDGTMFERVVLLRADGTSWQVGFSSSTHVDDDKEFLPVLVPVVPNPMSGRLLFVPRARCRVTDIPVKVGVMFVVSSGAYLPAPLHDALRAAAESG